jgi:ubiquinone/menaquinone biosynthesis C-methylase UbiE
MKETTQQGMRVKGTRVAIDEKAVQSFFARRHEKKLPHRWNYATFQDANPDLALVRDVAEKEKILPLLDIHPGMRVLDIGCGVGRWSGDILAAGADYVGVDYTQSFLDIAAEAQPPTSHCTWVCSDFQHVGMALKEREIPVPFDRILINAVFMYINDEDIPKCLSETDRLLARGGRLYLRESVSHTDRLTLDGIYSEELTSNYSAIYRSIREYADYWKRYLPGYRVLKEDERAKELVIRKETTSYAWLLQK